jgi:hypothetical protein
MQLLVRADEVIEEIGALLLRTLLRQLTAGFGTTRKVFCIVEGH